MKEIVQGVVRNALSEAKAKGVDIFTFALYYDHESPAISACIDTEESSLVQVRRRKEYSREYFIQAVSEGDLEEAATWCSNDGHSLEVGSFTLVNVARTELDKRLNKRSFLTILKVLLALQSEIAQQTRAKDKLLICSSGPNYEVEFFWSLADKPA
jgi:hypothetical protein